MSAAENVNNILPVELNQSSRVPWIPIKTGNNRISERWSKELQAMMSNLNNPINYSFCAQPNNCFKLYGKEY